MKNIIIIELKMKKSKHMMLLNHKQATTAIAGRTLDH